MHKRKPEELKDSGIEWVGGIPNGWNLKKIKFLSDIDPEELPNSTDPDYRFKYIDISSVNSLGKIEEYQDVKFADAPSRARKKVKLNDIIVSTVRTYLRAVARINTDLGDIICSTGFSVLRAEQIDPDFLFYSIISKGFIDRVEANSVGVSYPAIGSKDLGDFKIQLPEIEEQKAIATFLDHKTQVIEQLIEKKLQLIEKLKEKRQTLITRAVTKGLNPDTPMKDSGIEWLGEIPEHWEVTKTKFVTNKIIDGTHHTPTYTDEGVPFIRVTDIHDEIIDLNEVKRISVEEHKVLQKRCHPEKGDMLLSKNGTIGITKVIYWDWEFSIFVSLCLLKFKNDKILPAYYSYFFKSDIVDEQLSSGSKKTSVTNLHLDKIKELIVTLPPINEQKNIVDYMKRLHVDYQNAIRKAEISISKLQEYRQSLISAAVTGKIDVTKKQVM